MKYLLIGAAVAGLAVCPLHAQGKGHGQGNGGGHGNAAHGPSMKGPSMHGPEAKGPSMKGPSMKGPSMRPAARGHGNGSGSMASMHAAGPARGNGHGKVKAAEHGNGKAHAVQGAGGGNKAVHGRSEAARAAKGPDQGPGKGNGPAMAAAGKVKGGVKVLQDGRHYYAERGAVPAFDFASARRGPIDGCPPGLAKKNNGCQPPGLAKQRSYRPDWWGYSNLASDPYYYDDGYLLRMNGSSIASYLPLLGGALSVGNVWPSYYQPMPVPRYYADYYGLGPAGSYRYADNVLYNVDPSTSAISSIAALLTGDTFNIGSPLPPGYDVYNVPYGYRDQYVDGPDAWYRYSDGYVYQVDPTTRLVQAAIELLAI
jgi:hypothetical protein